MIYKFKTENPFRGSKACRELLEKVHHIESTDELASLTIHRQQNEKKKALISILYLTSLVLLPSCISFLVHKSVELGVINLGNTSQSEIVFNTLQEKSMIEKFVELEELFLLDEMIKEYPEPHRQKWIITIHKETIQLIKMYNEERIQMFFHFSTNIICFIILSGYYILGNEELRFLNSWIQEFLYNLSDTIKAFFIILVTDFWVGFHSNRIWELMIESVYKDFGFPHNDPIISILLSSCPVILDTIFKYSIFFYLNRLSPSLVVIYHSMKE